MKKQIFIRIITVVLVAELMSIGIFAYYQYRSNIKDVRSSMRTEMRYAEAGYRQAGTAFFESAGGGAGKESGDRVTIIAEDGTVTYDSFFDKDSLGNHGQREEIRLAKKSGEGYSERYSKDMMAETIYYAKRLPEGDYLRLSVVRPSIFHIYVEMRTQMLVLVLVTMLVCGILAYGISSRIVKPINSIDPKDPLKAETYPELRPLTERLDEQNREISRSMEKLRSDVDEKTREANFRREFTANVSHELKTPLTSISGYAELIKEGVTDEADTRKFAGKIYDEARRLRSLVNDIMTISRLDDEKKRYKIESVDLGMICEKVVSALTSVAKSKNVTINLKTNHINIDGAEDILYEMVYNICDNAIRYNKPGGRVDIEVSRKSVRPYVRVSDTGIGIPESEQERIFERFYMVDKNRSRELGGTGLGLAIVKHGAKFHNADIDVKSEVGRGTAITITFK